MTANKSYHLKKIKILQNNGNSIFNPKGRVRKQQQQQREKGKEEKLMIILNKLLRDRLQGLMEFHSSCTNVHTTAHNPLTEAY